MDAWYHLAMPTAAARDAVMRTFDAFLDPAAAFWEPQGPLEDHVTRLSTEPPLQGPELAIRTHVDHGVRRPLTKNSWLNFRLFSDGAQGSFAWVSIGKLPGMAWVLTGGGGRPERQMAQFLAAFGQALTARAGAAVRPIPRPPGLRL